MKLYVVKITESSGSGRMEKVLGKVLSRDSAAHICFIENSQEFSRAADRGLLRNERVLFAVELDKSGVNMEAYRILGYLNEVTGKQVLQGAVGGIIVDGKGEMYTKDMGRRLTFAANMAGCTFPGKPLTEATGNLINFKVISQLWKVDLEEAYINSCILLMDKILKFNEKKIEKPEILVIHASSRKTSNSLRLWEMVASHLEGKTSIEEISIRNGQVWDCRGCKYEDCLHFGENSGCFYGGVMVEKVYPAILKCDVLLLICPNYNDAVSANIMAFINRLTAVFRANDFSSKKVYALIVSGYSGGDIVAQQVISAINMNKNFILPGGFALIETANAPGEVMEIEGIEERAEAFAARIIA